MNQTAKLLLSEKLITKAQYEQAYLEAMATGGTMGFHLVEQMAITSEELVHFLQRRFSLPRKKRTSLRTIPDHVIRRISGHLAEKYRVLPISARSQSLELAVTDPADNKALDEVSRVTAMPVTPVLVSEADMNWALDHYYDSMDDDDNFRDTMDFSLSDQSLGAWDPQPAEAEKSGHRRETMSWGISIEDALASITVPVSEPEAEPQENMAPIDLIQRSSPDGLKIVEPIRINKEQTRPMTIAEEPAAPPPEPLLLTPDLMRNPEPLPATLDSWVDPTPAARRSEPATQSSTPPIRTSLFPKGRIARGSASIMPPAEGRMRTEGELLHAVTVTSSRDEIVVLALEYLLRFGKRAVFLITKQSEIRGFHVAGDYTNREAIRSFWIPFSARSTLGKVATTGQLHLGPLGTKPADAVFCAALGGCPGNALMIPIVIKGRTCGILFADHIEVQEIAWPRLTRLLDAVTSSLTRLLFKGKPHDSAGPSD